MAEKVLPGSALRGDTSRTTAHAGGIVVVPLASRRLPPGCGSETRDRGERGKGEATRSAGWPGSRLLLRCFSWSRVSAALPAVAGDPLGEVKEFTAGLTPDSGPNRIADGPGRQPVVHRARTGADRTDHPDRRRSTSSRPTSRPTASRSRSRRARTATCGSRRSRIRAASGGSLPPARSPSSRPA